MNGKVPSGIAAATARVDPHEAAIRIHAKIRRACCILEQLHQRAPRVGPVADPRHAEGGEGGDRGAIGNHDIDGQRRALDGMLDQRRLGESRQEQAVGTAAGERPPPLQRRIDHHPVVTLFWTSKKEVDARVDEERDSGVIGGLPRVCDSLRLLGDVAQGAAVRKAVCYIRVIERLRERGCDAVALVCTEIPLLITPDISPLPVLDSTRLLSRAAFEVAVGRRPVPAWRGGPVT